MSNEVTDKDYYDLFTSKLGKRVLEDLIEEYFDPVPYTPGADQNVNDTLFFVGCKNVIARIKYRMKEHEAAPSKHVDKTYL